MDSTKLAEKKTGKQSSDPAPILDGGGARKFVYRNREFTAGNLFIAIGSALAVVGLVDIALVWYPMQLGTAGWEFATVSRTFTNAPMTMVGLVLVAFGLVWRGINPRVMRGVAVLFVALSLILLLMGMLYGLAAPAVWSQLSEAAAVNALKRTLVKNGLEIVVYPTVLLLIAAILWYGVREDK